MCVASGESIKSIQCGTTGSEKESFMHSTERAEKFCNFDDTQQLVGLWIRHVVFDNCMNAVVKKTERNCHVLREKEVRGE